MEIQSPTRIDLAGGTLDCWPLYAFVGDCRTLNISIDIRTKVILEEIPSGVSINISNLNYQKSFKNVDEFMNCSDSEAFLIQSVFTEFPSEKPFKIETYSDSPVGGGLGGSSSLVVSLIKGFSKRVGAKPTTSEIVTMASHIEAKLLMTPTGTQDYYPAIEQGLNLISYSNTGASSRLLDYDVDYFNSRMSLVYTGKSHHSGINNWSVIQNVVNKEGSTLDTLSKLNQLSHQVQKVCEKASWGELGELFRKETELRVQLSPSFISPEIESLQKIAMSEGAEAVKICGAGGGGCVMIWSPPEKKNEVEDACLKSKFQVLPAKALPSVKS